MICPVIHAVLSCGATLENGCKIRVIHLTTITLILDGSTPHPEYLPTFMYELLEIVSENLSPAIMC